MIVAGTLAQVGAAAPRSPRCSLLAAGGARPDTTVERAGMFGAGHLESTSGEVIYQQICQGCHMPDATRRERRGPLSGARRRSGS